MPRLDEGRVYHRAEVEQYIGKQDGTSDYDVAAIHFPRNLQTWVHDFRGWRDGEEMLLQYQVYPMAEFKEQLGGLEKAFDRHDEHHNRVQAIVEALLGGERFYPVFIQQNDSQRRIIEGMHRAVALVQLESFCLPAFLTGYRNWFTPDELMPGFDKEDEITPATLRDVYAFFLHATCVDHRGIQLALFGSDRLGQCDEAWVAKHRGRVIGAVTMVVAKGRPTLSTVYVLQQYRHKGVAYRLSEKALTRLEEAGVEAVFCDVQSPGMEATLRRLARERPDLRALVKEQIGFLAGEDIEMGLDKELPEEDGN
jgi:GNAT superfamily N-acetyltransferase